MSIRIITTALAALAAMTGGTAAASIVTLGATAPAATPSIVTMGMPQAAGPSVVAFGAPWPPVTSEKVAAVPKKKRHDPAPVVMRGGDGTTPALARQVAGSPAPQQSAAAPQPPEEPDTSVEQ